MISYQRVFGVCLAVVFFANSCLADESKNILWYGNSFTRATCCGSSRSVLDVFYDISVAAGHPAPLNRNAASNGRSLQWHLDSNTFIIDIGVPVGEQWDHVVLQDHSTMPTHIGNLSQHLSSSLGLYQKVAEHSPNVVPVMYETWARGFGHSFYSGTNPDFPGGPAEMQQELREGYHLSAGNINTAVGTELAKYAPAGDAWELAGFPANFYGDGDYHAGNRGTLLNSLVLYGTIYGDPTTSDIDLSGVLTSLNLGAADGIQLTTLADAVLVPEPGTLILICLSGILLTVRRNNILLNS